jgi:hypothetical protein
MKGTAISRPVASLCLLYLAALVCACQGYAFEEVPSTAFKDRRWRRTWTDSTQNLDILLVIDDSPSMVRKQERLEAALVNMFGSIEARLEEGTYRIGVITTGMESDSCSGCQSLGDLSCLNESGETGCGYRRGLGATRRALQMDMLEDESSRFVREEAVLAVILVSDGEDCGEVGEVAEGIPGVGGDICYYASKGVGPEGESAHPEDPDARPYQLTPVEEYYQFLLSVKGDRQGMVKFATITGMQGPLDPTAAIEYAWDDSLQSWTVTEACSVPFCDGPDCQAGPGTRAIELARRFGIGKSGFAGSICQADLARTMESLGQFVSCPRVFFLSDPLRDPDLVNLMVNDEHIPRYTCDLEGRLVTCSGPGSSCVEGECVETWHYDPPEDPRPWYAQGGTITFADHYNPCEMFPDQRLVLSAYHGLLP